MVLNGTACIRTNANTFLFLRTENDHWFPLRDFCVTEKSFTKKNNDKTVIWKQGGTALIPPSCMNNGVEVACMNNSVEVAGKIKYKCRTQLAFYDIAIFKLDVEADNLRVLI